MAFELSKLPYAKNALAPQISEETLEFHHGKHHKRYVDNLNNLLPATEFEGSSLEDIIKTSTGSIFNNAAQVWNHTFYWRCLSPNGGGNPPGKLADAINKTFGSFENFKEEFTKASVTIFGSGWGWLVKKHDGTLEITTTISAGNPMTQDTIPILACDVWEHAYYIDYRDAKAAYLKAFFELVNWDFVYDRYME